MFSALKKLAKSGDDRCQAPVPMSSSLQKKFSRGVHYNMKILIKGDRNVGKSCLLQRLQGGPFIENYVPTEQIQAAPIHWTYKNTDHIVKVEVWEVVDKGRAKKKPPLGLKLENESAPAQEDGYETPVLDATFLDVYKNANGVILMLDITKPWTFEYVVKELGRVPADLPVVVLGNHCDMQHHRQVHPHHIDQALHQARLTRTAPVRYAESSMRNGFGLRLLHKFLNVPFLRLQRTSLLEQLQRNQRDIEGADHELDEFQNSEECKYDTFVERLTSARRSSAEPARAPERSPSIVLGGGKPIVPPGVNPLLAQSLNPATKPAQSVTENSQPKQTQYVSAELMKPNHTVSMDFTPPRPVKDSTPGTPGTPAAPGTAGALDEFYAGTLDSSFLDDLTPGSNNAQDTQYDSDSDENSTINPMVTIDQDDLDVDYAPAASRTVVDSRHKLNDMFTQQLLIRKDSVKSEKSGSADREHDVNDVNMDNDFTLWAGDCSARRSPEGGEDPDNAKEAAEKAEKKHKKKKSKDKDRGDYSDKSERKDKKSKHKKSKSDKDRQNPQQALLSPNDTSVSYDDYDSI
ncbi:rab-like protein 6 [Plutella xylostella]|uniref:rab-like protein 6 n=1 Tax=Plutella xylostella TaxID=51655 RepID=UPI00203286DD|nr:rab-like protein 6 [Plutella xylostella]